MRSVNAIPVILAACLIGRLAAQNQAYTVNCSCSTWVDVPHHASLVPATGLTVEMWLRPANLLGTKTFVLKNPNHPVGPSYTFEFGWGGNGYYYYAGVRTQANGFVSIAAGPVVVPVDGWQHVAMTFDNSRLRVYVDGALIITSPVYTGPVISPANPGALRIGQGWVGKLDAVRVWSVARTGQEIAGNRFYQFENRPGLVSSWNFDSNYLDSTGSNHGVPTTIVALTPSDFPVVPFTGAPHVAPIGATLTFTLTYPVAGSFYAFDISLTGAVPGMDFPGGVHVPLNPPWLNLDTGGAFSSYFVNFFGLLNSTGHASPTVSIPPDPALGGYTVSATYATLDANAPGGVAAMSPGTQTLLAGFAPVITLITPPTAPTVGGWPVTISGQNFEPGATVRFDGVLATNVVVTPSAISCHAPPHAIGTVGVVVENPSGLQATVPNGFAYVQTLSLSGATPLVAAPGSTMTVTGAGFTPGLTAALNGVPGLVAGVTPSSFQFVVPQGTFCAVPLTATLLDGQTSSITVNPFPVITGLLGPPGSPSGGSSFFLVGSNFFPGTTIEIGGLPAAIASVTPTVILATAPPGQSGPAPLVVTLVSGCTAATTYVYE